MTALLGIIGGFSLALLAQLGSASTERPWLRSIEPSRCGSDELVEYPERPRWIRHAIVPRETIAQIAARYGVSELDLRAHNGLSAKTKGLRKGTRLRVKARRMPAPRRHIEYVVQEGDSWSSIARQHGADGRDVQAYNWPWQGKLRPGTKISVWADPLVTDWVGDGDESPVRAGAIGSGPPDAGRLFNGVAIPEGDGYRLGFPDASYGTTHAVAELVRALTLYRERSSYPADLELRGMSRIHGGPFGDHRSHQTGRDLDISLPRRMDVPAWLPLTPRRVDWLTVWHLVRALFEVDANVVYLDYALQKHVRDAALAAGVPQDEIRPVLQYPRGRAAQRGLARHMAGHDRHLHVRFGCGPCEPECVERIEIPLPAAVGTPR